MSDYCEHGFRKVGSVRNAGPPSGGDGQRRRVDLRAPPPDHCRGTDADEGWERIGELGGPLDFSRIGGWRPLGEFLWRR
jgi:hypothetical protein